MHYWGYRIATKDRDFFFEELTKGGRLRQGWGYESTHDLRLGDEVDSAARGNLSIFNKVKRGDILLIPRIEGWDDITIAEATDDFCMGYRFEIDPVRHDYGHIFPARFIKQFSRQNDMVSGNIRETMKCRSRFWNIDRCAEDIDRLIRAETNLTSGSTYAERFKRASVAAFDETRFTKEVYQNLLQCTQASEWEQVLREGFERMLPENYVIETTSNRTEAQHGADVLIRIPGILDTSYVIAIQIKDYEGVVGENPIEQICKADSYFNDRNEKLIDKYVIMIGASEEENQAMKEQAAAKDVKLIFRKDLEFLLTRMAKAFIGSTIFD